MSPTLPAIIIGVTGHRDVDEAEVASAARSIRDLLRDVQEVISGRCRLIAASALAAGADQLFAHEALRNGLKVIAPLPMMRDEYRATFTDLQSKAEFDALARDVQCFCVADWKQSPPMRTDLPAADAAFQRLGDMLDSTCAVLVALWDGTFCDSPGGTGDTVGRRLAGDRSPAPIFWIPTSRRLGGQVRGRTGTRAVFVRPGQRPGELSEVLPTDVHRMLSLACDYAESPADDEGLEALHKRLLRATDLTHWLLNRAAIGRAKG